MRGNIMMPTKRSQWSARRAQGHRSQAGSALLASLAVVIGVGALTAVSLQLQTARLSRLQTENDRKRAFYLAEAALAEARLSLQQDGSGNIGSEALPAAFGDGYIFTETVEDEFGILHLDAYGIQGSARERLSMAVQKQFKPLAREGFYGKDFVMINAGVQTIVDKSVYETYQQDLEAAKDAALATDLIVAADGLPQLPEDINPRISGDGAITVFGGTGSLATTIDADVRPGPGRSFVWPMGAIITGLTAPRPEKADLPNIVLPQVPAGADIVVSSGTPQSYNSDKQVARVEVKKDATLYLTGPMSLVVERWIHHGIVVVDGSAGPVDVFVTEDLHIRSSGSFVNVGAKASHLRIQMTAKDAFPGIAGVFRFDTTQQFIGQIYAPNANIALPALSWIKGSISAWTLVVGGRSLLEHDPLLLVDGLGKTVMTPISWRVDVAPEEIANPLNYDPAGDYAALSIVPPTPVNSHRPLAEVVRFVHAESGKTVTLRGNRTDLPARKFTAVLDVVLPNDVRWDDVKLPGGVVDDSIDDDLPPDAP
jgi:hypothetical protein